MMNRVPFTDHDYNIIFRQSKSNPDIVNSRENGTLEFKESFSSDVLNRSMKTIAGFANNEGGYIVFGIKDKPHFLSGLNIKSEERFDSLDPAKLTENLNNHFAPAIRVEMQKYIFNEKSFGIMYVFESESKPVICAKSEGENLRESAIYYRYRGQSREIRYSELRTMLDLIIEKNNQIWQETFRQIGKIGVENIALINTATGDLSIDGRNYLIDEKLLEKLNYVEEGRFVEKNGAPTLKLVGNIKTIDGNLPIMSNTKVVTKAGIRAENIVRDFLQNIIVDNPLDYIVQICFESSSYLPVFYYIKQSGNSISEVIDIIDNVRSRAQSKVKLIKRIKNKPTLSLTIVSSAKESFKKKSVIKEAILSGIYERNDDVTHVKYFCQVIRSLSRIELIEFRDLISNILLQYYQEYYLDRDFKHMDDLRKAVCFLDTELYAR